MSAQDRWALYLDPNTDPDIRAEIGAELEAEETAALGRIGHALSDEASWGGPSAGLKEQLLAQARAEQASRAPGADATGRGQPDRVDGAGGHDFDGPGPAMPAMPGPAGHTGAPAAPIDELAARRARRSRAARIGAALATAAAVVAAVVFVVRPGDTADVTTFEVAGTEFTPDLDATVDIEPRVAGVAITLHIKGMGPAGDGQYYAGWLVEDTGAPVVDPADVAGADVVGIGSFHWRAGGIPIELWSGVDTERYPILFVTLQDEGDPPTPSGVVVMTARVDG